MVDPIYFLLPNSNNFRQPQFRHYCTLTSFNNAVGLKYLSPADMKLSATFLLKRKQTNSISKYGEWSMEDLMCALRNKKRMLFPLGSC